MLEVGTGTGGIAHYFGTHADLDCSVDAVDTVDGRRIVEGYRFHRVNGTDLPFADDSFDVILSNHVVEHVGEYPEQVAHLSELHRVMAPNGIGYLAVPNRWMLVEPHYRLAFLSWLPRRWRTPYLRISGKGSRYDCEPLEAREVEAMLAAVGFRFESLCVRALREWTMIERTGALSRLSAGLPDSLLLPFQRAFPTLIYKFTKK